MNYFNGIVNTIMKVKTLSLLRFPPNYLKRLTGRTHFSKAQSNYYENLRLSEKLAFLGSTTTATKQF